MASSGLIRGVQECGCGCSYRPPLFTPPCLCLHKATRVPYVYDIWWSSPSSPLARSLATCLGSLFGFVDCLYQRSSSYRHARHCSHASFPPKTQGRLVNSSSELSIYGGQGGLQSLLIYALSVCMHVAKRPQSCAQLLR